MGSLLKQISANEIATVQFLKWTDLYIHEKPFQMFLEINAESNEQRTSNLQFEEKSIAVENIRGYEHLFELDKHGFIIRPFPSAPSCLRDINRETVVSSYFPAVDELLRQELEDVDRTFLLDWRVRSADPVHHENKTTINLLDLTSRLKPANAAHIDQSPLWLPLFHAVEDWPLALCDGSTVSLQDDLVETDNIRRTYQSANMYMMHRENHKWYFLKKQDVNEVLIFKQFDTEETQAEVCPHVSFLQNGIPAGTPPRQSIEMRVIVFTYPH
ncbi:hypothetical protein BOTCAL_0918g00040 [Botryotinia calthae]|uniref:Uncharacterized protein n=1 Tax=Botryotinia calthae TaxID=38488 RepID=A0A4Y8CFP6_9HELO|nr:hypothetical protein BOTCAL_0918g00040 [Botryotinia calthae]